MTEPPRLRDDETAPPRLRGALRAAEHADPGFDVAAGLARLEGSIASGPKPAGRRWVHGVAVGGAVALVVGLALLAARLAIPAPVAPPSAPLAPPPSRPTSPRPAPAVHDAPAQPPGPVVVSPAAPEAPVRAPVRTADPLALELRLVVEARRSTHTVPAHALSLLARADREVGEGVLGAERETLRVEALAVLGRTDEAERRARAFFAAHPGDPLETRVRAAVGAPR